MLMIGMMLASHGLDGVLIVAGAGPSDFPEAPKDYFLFAKHWEESLREFLQTSRGPFIVPSCCRLHTNTRRVAQLKTLVSHVLTVRLVFFLLAFFIMKSVGQRLANLNDRVVPVQIQTGPYAGRRTRL